MKLAALLLTLLAGEVHATARSGLEILTYPVGVVAGKLTVLADLGPSGAPADLLLDGVTVCSLTGASPRCDVETGAAPHVHLLELVRRDDSGRVVARATRWINRPGREAGLTVALAARTAGGICGGRVIWFHPDKQDPVDLEVTEGGRRLRILSDRRSFRFPCPDPDASHVVAASAVFPDGRRAEAVALAGVFGGEAEAGLTAVPLVPDAPDADPSIAVASLLRDRNVPTQESGFEVVFVIDPSSGYRTTTVGSPGLHSGLYGGPPLTRRSRPVRSWGWGENVGRSSTSWERVQASLAGADRMWFVTPDAELHRLNGFAKGRDNWFRVLVAFATQEIRGVPRLADAVAASGLVAAAGPRRRAVVLILGSQADKDSSNFTPEQAGTYLAEIGVPLFVLRKRRCKKDLWPRGIPADSHTAMAAALETVRDGVSRQCIAWFPESLSPAGIAASLPPGLHVAGGASR